MRVPTRWPHPVFESPPEQPLILRTLSMARLSDNTRDVLLGVCSSSRLPRLKFSVPLVQELLELALVVEGPKRDIPPLTTPLVVTVVERDEPPDAVFLRVYRRHGARVERERADGRQVVDLR